MKNVKSKSCNRESPVIETNFRNYYETCKKRSIFALLDTRQEQLFTKLYQITQLVILILLILIIIFTKYLSQIK